MGRKSRGAALLLLPLLCGLLGGASSYGEVGCTYSTKLCKSGAEECYNDLAFGRCVQMYDRSEKDLYKYNLEPEELELLRVQLERLEFEGFKWSDDYTQCVMQILLDDLRYRLNNDVEHLCKNLRLRASEDIFDDGDEKEVIVKDDAASLRDPSEPVAIVKFTPSQGNPHGEFADEFYYPPEMRQWMDDITNPEEVYHRGSRSLSKQSLGPPASPLTYPQENYRIRRQYVEALHGFLESNPSIYEGAMGEGGLEFLSDGERFDEPDNDDYEKTFSSKYKYPKGLESIDFRNGPILDGDEDYEDEEPAEGYDGASPIAEPIIDALAAVQQRHTEAGTILPQRHDVVRPEEYDDLSLDNDLDDMLWRREIAGFKRRERLDVKKPGPPFSTNNYAFKTQSPPSMDDENSEENTHEDDEVVYLPQQVKKEVPNTKFNSSPKTYENVDLDHVYMQFNQAIQTWFEGENVVNLVEAQLGLEKDELKDIRVGAAEVTFKVPKNSKNYNATDIVNKLDGIRPELKKQLNIDLIRAGIGDKTKLPAMLEVSKRAEMNSSIFGALVAAGVAAVSAAAIIILIIARRHAKTRQKLAGLRTPDPEASKDYQELCRVRMQAKQSDKLAESPKAFDFGRLIESGKSESNRSSTSSWSEEPQVANIDVTTGHAVLSYLQNFLENQEKLDEEWANLSNYEAEPCSTATAQAEENNVRNRSGTSLPYDHSRVILNDLGNIDGSSYINASTITDHDPRNPAYIATQGPLPHTTADFWQLVWEQGSVVIVMLTRLTEEGQAMCHRYWPDEGSELYHIYEVHLVSEHIWCDDYLVRSFYLKNLRTGESRTVTQFHFLSWPQKGVPESTKALLEFRRKVNKSYRGRSCPIIVHCSDGAGRTGTYCLIDMVLNRMTKGAKEIDIAATLEHIRDQRAGMVSTKQQFEFVLMAVAEEVHAILKSLPIIAAEKPGTSSDKSPVKATKSDK